LPDEEPEEKTIIVQPPIEIVIPAAGVLVEKGQEYQMEKDIIKEPPKKKMPQEEVKEIKATNIEEEDLIINKPRKGPSTPNIDAEATANTFYNTPSTFKRG